MKKITILLITLIFIACGGEVSSDGNKKNSGGNSNTSTNNTNTNNNNQTSDPGGFGPPVQDSGISKPKV